MELPENYYENEEFRSFIWQLVNDNILSGIALDIANVFVNQGAKAFSPSQMRIFREDIVELYTTKECARCAQPIPWEEMFEALDNGGICGRCWFQYQEYWRNP